MVLKRFMLHNVLMSPQLNAKRLGSVAGKLRRKKASQGAQPILLEEKSANQIVNIILLDTPMTVMTALMSGQRDLDKAIIREKTVRDVALTYSLSPYQFESELFKKIATLHSKGDSWISKKSRELRAEFRKKHPIYIDNLQKLGPSDIEDKWLKDGKESIRAISEEWDGLYLYIAKKSKSKASGAGIAALFRKFKSKGTWLLILVKESEDKKSKIDANTVLEKISRRLKDADKIDELHIRTAINNVSNELGEEGKKASVAVVYRKEGGALIVGAGEFYLEDKLKRRPIPLAGEELGSNFQRIRGKKGAKHMKLGALKVDVKKLSAPFLLSTMEVSNAKKLNVEKKLTKSAVEKLRKKTNLALASIDL